MRFNSRAVVESQHGETVLEQIVVRRPQRREVETVVGAVVQAREKFGDGLRLFGVAFGHVNELQERIEAAVTIASADLRCALRRRLAAVRVRKKLGDGVLESLEEVLGHVAGNPVRFRPGRNVHGVTLIVRSRRIRPRTRVR